MPKRELGDQPPTPPGEDEEEKLSFTKACEPLVEIIRMPLYVAIILRRHGLSMREPPSRSPILSSAVDGQRQAHACNVRAELTAVLFWTVGTSDAGQP